MCDFAPPPESCDIGDLHFDLPEDRIAPAPAPQRDAARMLIVRRDRNEFTDAVVSLLHEYLAPGDLVVLNNTRVLPARFFLPRTGAEPIEGLYLGEIHPGSWRVLLKHSSRIRVGQEWRLCSQNASYRMHAAMRLENGEWNICVDPPQSAHVVLGEIGTVPLPPYIRRARRGNSSDSDWEQVDQERYQTVYASRPGAIAAPTAGLHITASMLQEMALHGIRSTFVTLHVGIGTFRPIQTSTLSEHAMHEEYFEVGTETAEAIRCCRKQGGRVVAIGTTSVRALESAAQGDDGELRCDSGLTRIFIRPPYRFRVVDALFTNFHLPRSTLLALVMAFAGVRRTQAAYEHAIRNAYRFYSYGDAMLIL